MMLSWERALASSRDLLEAATAPQQWFAAAINDYAREGRRLLQLTRPEWPLA
jgi:hypothetical protein